MHDVSDPLVTYYLEMREESDLRPKDTTVPVDIVESCIPQFQFNRFLYQYVGEAWQWTEKLSWSDAQWRNYVENAFLRTWVAYHQGTPAGYFELQKQAGGDVQIAYFGLAQSFIGKGFGGFLLSCALRQAWQWPGTQRVWVHTCNRDHPSALNNYRARGMMVYRVDEESTV